MKLVKLVLKWWKEHQYDCYTTDDDEYNMYDDEPDFVKEAVRLSNKKLKAKWVKCTGEAHRPEVKGNIDNCMVCMPWWEDIAVCPKCSYHPLYHKLSAKGYCKRCKKYYEVDK